MPVKWFGMLMVVLALSGCKTLELVGLGGQQDAVVLIAEEALLKAAEKKGVTLDRSTVKAFTKLIQERPEIDALVAKVVADNAEHEEIRDLSERLAGSFLGD